LAQRTIFELDLLAIAKQRAHATAAALTNLIYNIAWIIFLVNASNTAQVSILILWGLSISLTIWAVVSMVMLQIALGANPGTIVLYAILTLIFSFLALISAISQASTVLKLAGAKLGFIGVSESERAKITPGNCRGCGYDRTGLELLQECPECQRVPQVI
jgi:succinate-acetate transporter protein